MKNGCANRTQSRARSSYAEVKPAIDEVNEELGGPNSSFFNFQFSIFNLQSSFNIVVRDIVPYVRPVTIGGNNDEAYKHENKRHIGGRKAKP